MVSLEKQKLIAEINSLSKILYLIDQTEMDPLLKNINVLPEAGLRQSLALLKDAKVKQDEILSKLAVKDPSLDKNLRNFLRKEYQAHVKNADTQEKKNADDILKNL